MRPFALLLPVVLLGSACTHTYTLRTADGPAAYAAATDRMEGRTGEVLTREGQVFRWRDVRFTPDSTFGTPVAAGVDRVPAVRTDRVVEVQARSRGRGAAEGALIGAGIGAVLGIITGPDENCAVFYGPCAETTAQQAAFHAFGGAFWGVIIGLIRQTRHKVEVR